jgi:hypothetical protein
VDAGRGQVAERQQPLLVLGAGAGQPLPTEGQGRERRLEEDPLRLPLVDGVALHDPLPAAHRLVEPGADPAGGVDAQVATELATGRAKARSHEQLRGPEGAAAHDHAAPGAEPNRPAGARPRRVGPVGEALDPGRAMARKDDSPDVDPGPDAGTGPDRARQVGDVHRALGVQTTADRAGAALVAVAGVAVQRTVADLESRRAAAQ